MRKDRALEQIHWATTRKRDLPQVLAFAFDHRIQLEAMADETGREREAITEFKRLCLDAALEVARERADCGILLDDRYGEDLLAHATGRLAWIGRPIELPGAIPLCFDGALDLGSRFREWPLAHCIKCLVFYHPDDPEELKARQEAQVLTLAEAARATRHELLLEVIASRSGRPCDPDTLARALRRFYELGVMPDWWKLPSPTSTAEWQAITAAIDGNDPHCRGVLLLGLEAPEPELLAAFALAARAPICKGFAIGRTIFGEPALAWFRQAITDGEATTMMATRYRRLVAAWDAAASERPATRVR